jgi:hypothetical protein
VARPARDAARPARNAARPARNSQRTQRLFLRPLCSLCSLWFINSLEKELEPMR